MTSATEWNKWLAGQEMQTLDSFLAKPMHAFSMCQAERSTSKDYHGREILELLQNGADQAILAMARGRIRIELEAGYLLFANTGKTFSKAGVSSLQNPHVSAKRNARLVGNKGLGFRSVLNWSDEPVIFSDGLQIAYSKEKLTEIESELIKKSDQYARELEEQYPGRKLPQLPLLPFPLYANASGEIDLSYSDANMIQRCHALIREEKYDTVIAMPFNFSSSFSNARDQIDNLTIEVLLFVSGLNDICISIEGLEKRFSKEKSGKRISLIEDGELSSQWILFESRGKLPSDIGDEEKSPNEYELLVAVPRGDIADMGTGFLYSYFATQVELPIRARCHASLELEQNRNHLIESDQNELIIRKLGEFVAQVVEKSAEKSLCKPAYLLVKPEENPRKDKYLQTFFDALLENLREKKFVPTIDRELSTPQECIGIYTADADWLPAKCFPDVVNTQYSGDNKFFEQIGVEFLSANVVQEKLIQLSNLSSAERSMMIWGVETYSPELAHPGLLINENSEIDAKARVFTFSEQMSDLKFPEWSRIFVLDESLKEQLLKKFEYDDQRELQQQMTTNFGLREFSFTRMIESVVADANRVKKASKGKQRQINEDLVYFLASIFRQGWPVNIAEFPSNIGIPLPTQARRFENSTKLYLGKHYGYQGETLQGLYSNVDRGLLVAGPERLNLNLGKDLVVEFLKWIGVKDRPRVTKTAEIDSDFIKFVATSLVYPIRFQEYALENAGDFRQVKFHEIKTMDRLDDVLASESYEAILAWLSSDTRLSELKLSSRENATISLRRGQDRNQRYFSEPLPSYINWKIQNTSWMKDKSNLKHAPTSCVFGTALNEASFPKPKIPTPKQLTKFGLDRGSLAVAFRHAGVITSLDELSSDELYGKLLELPLADPKGSTAKSMYMAVLESDLIPIDESNHFRRLFIETGQMWGHQGDNLGYFELGSLFYIDSEGIPYALTSKLPIVDLPRKRGAKKIHRFFGINTISKAELEQNVLKYTPSSDPVDDFSQAKPYFYLLRTDPKKMELERLHDLELVFCDQVTCKFSFQETVIAADLKRWEWVIDGNKLYVVVDPKVGVISDLVSDSIGSAIASLFGLAGGTEFASIYRCVPEYRKDLLEKMRGEEVPEDAEAIFTDLGIYEFASEDELLKSPIPEQETLPTEDEDGFQDIDDEAVVPSKIQNETNAKIEITELEYLQKKDKQKVKLSIRKLSGNRQTSAGYQLTDSVLCQELAFQFEKLQGRFPLKVGHVVGIQGFGCDLLSFENQDIRDKFEKGITREMEVVSRLIEVKGRKKGSSDIELKGNELTAAKRYKKKYYIYRIFKVDEDDFELGILNAPTLQKEVLQEAVYIDLLRSTKTQRYLLSKKN